MPTTKNIEYAYTLAGEFAGLNKVGSRLRLVASVQKINEDDDSAILRVKCYTDPVTDSGKKVWDVPMMPEEFKQHLDTYSRLTRLKTVKMPPVPKSAVDFTKQNRAEGVFIGTKSNGEQLLVKIVLKGSGYHLRAYNRETLVRVWSEKDLSLSQVRTYFDNMFVSVKRGRFPSKMGESMIEPAQEYKTFSFTSWLEN